MTFEEACQYIKEASKLGSKPGLSRIKGLCRILKDPQDDLRFIHVAGTNGKGSTACMISSVLAEAGFRIGMYYSPAMTWIGDHYMINNEPVSMSRYASCVSEVAIANEQLIEQTGESATQFELETAVAFVCFRQEHCDAVVMECGMGGRDDATNIVRNKICCVLTSISYDHMQYLGNTLSDIAKAKAGIITSDCPVIAFDPGDEVVSVIRDKCNETGSRLYVVKENEIRCDISTFPDGIKVSFEEISDAGIHLNGSFQARNVALAIKTLTVIRDNELINGRRPADKAILAGLGKAKWPFRFEVISTDPLVIADGAHNEDAARMLHDTIKYCLAGYLIILVMGVFADKEYEKVVKILSEVSQTIFTVETPDNPRALPAGDLAKCARKYVKEVRACASIKEACELSVNEASEHNKSEQPCAVIACGSLSYLKEFAGYFSPVSIGANPVDSPLPPKV